MSEQHERWAKVAWRGSIGWHEEVEAWGIIFESQVDHWPHDELAIVYDENEADAIVAAHNESQLTEALSQRQAAVEEAERLRLLLAPFTCPCALGEPCRVVCSCHTPTMSGGCSNPKCPRLYGKQRLRDLERELAVANQDAEALAKALKYIEEHLSVDGVEFRLDKLTFVARRHLTAHRARLASQPPVEAEGA